MDRTCDTCGQRVGISSGSEGTCSYEPVAERECDSLRTENLALQKRYMAACEHEKRLEEALEWYAEPHRHSHKRARAALGKGK